MSGIYVIDACALVALIKGEQGDEVVWDVFYKSATGEATVFMHEINLLEVYYGFYRERGKDYAEQKIKEASAFFTTLHGLAPVAFSEAGRLKSSYRMSLADAVALATASVYGGKLVTADHHELDVVEQNEEIDFLWFR